VRLGHNYVVTIGVPKATGTGRKQKKRTGEHALKNVTFLTKAERKNKTEVVRLGKEEKNQRPTKTKRSGLPFFRTFQKIQWKEPSSQRRTAGHQRTKPAQETSDTKKRQKTRQWTLTQRRGKKTGMIKKKKTEEEGKKAVASRRWVTRPG